MKEKLHPFAAATLTASLSVAPLTFEDIPLNIDCGYENGQPNISIVAEQGSNLERFCPPIERAEGQTFGAFIYGHRERDMIMEHGDIADGAKPINGKEYTEEDVQLVFQQLRELKYANIDFGILSWHRQGEVRDKYLKFFLDSMKRTDNPYPDFKVTIIYELDSNLGKIPDEILDSDLEYIRQNYLSDPHFLKTEDENTTPIMFVFNQYEEGIIDNPGFAEQWFNAGQEYGFEPYLEAYFGDSLNPFNDDLHWYQYADEIFDLLPSGIHITRDTARVNPSYSKAGDLKTINFDKNKFRKNLIKASQSGKMVLLVSWNEYWEHTNLEGNREAQQVMHEIFPGKKSVVNNISGDQYVEFIQHLIETQEPIGIEENLPPVQPKENQFFGIVEEKARKKKIT